MQFEGRANKATLGQQLCLGKSNGAGAAERIEHKLTTIIRTSDIPARTKTFKRP